MPARPQKKHRRAKPAVTPNPAAFFTQAEVDAARNAAQGDGANRTPAVVRDAFFPPHLKIARFPLQPFTLATYMLLEQVGCRIVTDREKAANFDAAQAGYALTRPIEEVIAKVAEGTEAFNAAVWGFAAQVPAGEMETFAAVIGRQLAAGFATVIAEPAEGAKKNATAAQPSRGPSPTALAGG